MIRSIPPKFSVVITCFNNRSTVEAAIHSARAQQTAVETIVVDDGSTDGSRAVLEFCDADRVILNEDNVGALGAYLTGFRAAVGQYLVMLDADDRLVSGILVALEDLLDETTCVRMGMAPLDSASAPAPAVLPLRRALTFWSGRLFTLTQSTGGTAYVFPSSLFKKADLALQGHWPAITVQDHILPGMVGLKCRRFIKLASVGYLMEPPGEAPRLSQRTARLHHDRLLSDDALAKAAEGALQQGLLVKLILRGALVRRMTKLGKIYGIPLPSIPRLLFSERWRDLSVRRLASAILSSGGAL